MLKSLDHQFSNFLLSGLLYTLKNWEDPKELVFMEVIAIRNEEIVYWKLYVLEIKIKKSQKYLLFISKNKSITYNINNIFMKNNHLSKQKNVVEREA